METAFRIICAIGHNTSLPEGGLAMIWFKNITPLLPACNGVGAAKVIIMADAPISGLSIGAIRARVSGGANPKLLNSEQTKTLCYLTGRFDICGYDMDLNPSYRQSATLCILIVAPDCTKTTQKPRARLEPKRGRG